MEGFYNGCITGICSEHFCRITGGNFKQLGNNVLNDIFICFVIILAGSYLKSTLVIEFIKLFNLM